jgi:hypothetical protein
MLEQIAEVDAYLADAKTLQQVLPKWQPSARPLELTATWNVVDSTGIIRSQLRFRCLRDRSHPSVSLVLGGQALCWRVDLVPPTVCKLNPVGAAALGLPARLYGPHSHGWPDNREYVASAGVWHLPYRRPLPAQIRRLSQALYWLADQVNLTLGHDQRGFDVPPQADLFNN